MLQSREDCVREDFLQIEVVKRVKIHNSDRGKYLLQYKNSKARSLINISSLGCLCWGVGEHLILLRVEHVLDTQKRLFN